MAKGLGKIPARGMSEAEILAGQSPRGGFTRAQLAKWGVSWPPPKGWKRRLMANPNDHRRPARSGKATPAQARYIESLREQYDPLSSGSEIPAMKEKAGAEIARLLQLKLKYEAMTRPPKQGGKPRGSGQFRYPRGGTNGGHR